MTSNSSSVVIPSHSCKGLLFSYFVKVKLLWLAKEGHAITSGEDGYLQITVVEIS